MLRLMGLAGSIFLSNLGDLKVPYRMTYILTNRCQGRCVMCNIWKKTHEDEMTLEQIEEFFKKSNHFSWINLSGGEIFLRPDLLPAIKTIYTHCKKLYILNFPTNGLETGLITETTKKILSDFRIPRFGISVSLDGPPDIHNSIRNLPGLWDKAVETFARLRVLRSRSFSVFLGWTLQAANWDKFDETFSAVKEKIRDIRHDEFHINIAHTSGHYYMNTDSAGIGDPGKALNEFNRIVGLRRHNIFDPVAVIEKRYQDLCNSFIKNKKTPVPCQALSASFFMDPSGTVYPCSIFDKPLGNIRDFGYSLPLLWNSGERRLLRQEISKGNCPHCWTPCEAYQSILANLLPKFRRDRFD